MYVVIDLMYWGARKLFFVYAQDLFAKKKKVRKWRQSGTDRVFQLSHILAKVDEKVSY